MQTLKQAIFLIIVLLVGCSSPPNNTIIPFDQKWEFKQEGTSEWLPAKVPGVVHTDLLALEMIPDPWVGVNENKVQWIEDQNWTYRYQFDLADSQLGFDHLDLVFEGLDTYAEVLLNDSLVLTANNMFRTWRVPVKNMLTSENELIIKFHSPIQSGKVSAKALNYHLPASSETVEVKVSPFVRKAPYHFGWDWGPRLVTSGIWKPTYLEAWSNARIANVQVVQKSLTDTLALMEGIVEIVSDKSQRLNLKVFDEETEINIEKGLNKFSIPFGIRSPERWWPNGWGDQKLYNIPVLLSSKQDIIDSQELKVGLRTIELLQEKDSTGKEFLFKVNGEPLFARGANYIPQSHFLPSVADKDYKELIENVKSSGMNMLRVWGGGIYENDIFYDLCDQNGILVWQDFMFAGTMYPGDSSFFANVEHEVVDNVKRLRNHASLAYWNGNNEIEVAWKNWGWQKHFGYTSNDSIKIWNDYLSLFHDRIPKLLKSLDDRSYTTTSPLSNWGTPENFNYGSMHYWGVWHGKDGFEDYRKNVGRFMSEYGFQSFPNMETISYFADSSEWNLATETMMHHQKSYVGNGLIQEQAIKYFDEPIDFEDFVTKSQKVQAIAMQKAIDAHRLKKGHCWGSLFWQLNDCWPGPSWSAIDVFGRHKLFYDELHTLFAPIALIPEWNGDEIRLTLVNDSLNKIEGIVKLISVDHEGIESVLEIPVSCPSNGISEVYRGELPHDIQYVKIKLMDNEKVLFFRTSVK